MDADGPDIVVAPKHVGFMKESLSRSDTFGPRQGWVGHLEGVRNAKNPGGVVKAQVARTKYIAEGPKSEFGRGNTRGVPFGRTNASVSTQ